MLFLAVFPVTDACVGGRGPFRMLVDTGAQSTTILPEVALALRLKPEYKVQIDNPRWQEWAAGHPAVPVGVGGQAPVAAEVLWHDAAYLRGYDARLRGVLGMNALRQRNFLLDLRTGTVDFDVVPAERGVVIPFTWLEGRMVVEARVDGRRVRLVLDSAASHLVLFRAGERVEALEVGPAHWTGVTAVFLPGTVREEDGLLPAELFDWIYVDVTKQRLVARVRK